MYISIENQSQSKRKFMFKNHFFCYLCALMWVVCPVLAETDDEAEKYPVLETTSQIIGIRTFTNVRWNDSSYDYEVYPFIELKVNSVQEATCPEKFKGATGSHYYTKTFYIDSKNVDHLHMVLPIILKTMKSKQRVKIQYSTQGCGRYNVLRLRGLPELNLSFNQS